MLLSLFAAEVEDALSPTYIAVTDPADDLNATIQLGSSPLPDATAGADDGPDYIAVNDPRESRSLLLI